LDNFEGFKQIVSDWEVEHVGRSKALHGESVGYFLRKERRFDLFKILAEQLREKGFSRPYLEGKADFLVKKYTSDRSKKLKDWKNFVLKDWMDVLKEVYYGESKDVKFDPSEPMPAPTIIKPKESYTKPAKADIVEEIDEETQEIEELEDPGMYAPAIIDIEAARFLGYTDEQLIGLFGEDALYE
jgi:hypothetical protein